MPVLALVCILTFLHFTAAQMRGPILPLYASTYGATATWVGIIIGAHMMVAAAASIPLGRAADRWGRRPLMLAGMAISALSSFLLPLFEGPLALMLVFAVAGVGLAAFTPSALAVVGDTAAASGKAGAAFGWYTTAHYGAIAIGPFLGGLGAEWWGYRSAFVLSGVGVLFAFALGWAAPTTTTTRTTASTVALADIRNDAAVWAAWIASASGLSLQGVVFTFFPLLAFDRGMSPSQIGTVFLVLGLANTIARFPAGWLIDRTGATNTYVIAGLLTSAVATALLPFAEDSTLLLIVAAILGASSGIAFVAIGVALNATTTAATRGIVMGGYSTSLYLGFALGAFLLGPVFQYFGFTAGFAIGAIAGTVGTLLACALWVAKGLRIRRGGI